MRFPVLIMAFCAFASGATAAGTRTFTIGGIAFVEGDIVDARALPDLAGMPTIMITFSKPAAQRFGVLTAKRKGKPLPIMLDGKVLAQPVVSDAILRGEAQISGSWPYEEAVRLAKQISGKNPLPDDLEQ
jgi:preprotein translocase subunit SecD